MLLLVQLLIKCFHQLVLRLSFEVSEVSAVQNFLFVQANEVDAVLLKLVSIVSVSQQEYLQSALDVHVFFEVARADINESRQQEVVCVDHELDEELGVVSLDVEVV